jgi:hypothetical protein
LKEKKTLVEEEQDRGREYKKMGEWLVKGKERGIKPVSNRNFSCQSSSIVAGLLQWTLMSCPPLLSHISVPGPAVVCSFLTVFSMKAGPLVPTTWGLLPAVESWPSCRQLCACGLLFTQGWKLEVNTPAYSASGGTHLRWVPQMSSEEVSSSCLQRWSTY